MSNTVPNTSRALVFTGWVCASCRSAAGRKRFYTVTCPPRGRRTLRCEVSQPNSFNRHAESQYRSFASSKRQQQLATDVSTRREKLPDYPARTRFAPSPTGYMHVGGLRTALFSYLLAARTGGQFILRIEDTDQKRLVDGAEQRIFDDLHWAGLQWDEGPEVGGPYGPYKQSERNDIYREHADQLLDSGAAYRCFCTTQTSGAGSAAFVTSGCYQNCSSLAQNESHDKAERLTQPFTVRLKLPREAHKRVYPDLVYGKIKRLKRSPSASPVSAGSAEDGSSGGIDAADTILIKSDGTPTYHFANVVDDHLMKITHVIRGTEWMASTPLHYDLYHAFGWDPPQFAHVGLLLDSSKAKLSKRSGTVASDVAGLRDRMGIYPEPLINFLVLLGWSNPGSNDVMSMQDMIKNFDLKFTTGNTVCDTKKLVYLQKHHVQRWCSEARQKSAFDPIARVVDRIHDVVKSNYGHRLTGDALKAQNAGVLWDFCAQVLLADDKSYETAQQFVERNDYLFTFDASRLPSQDTDLDLQLGKSSLELSDELSNLFNNGSMYPSTDRDMISSRSIAVVEGIETASKSIHESLVRLVWQAVVRQIQQKPTSDDSEQPQASRRAATDRLLETIQASDDVEAIPELIASHSDAEKLDVQELQNSYKALNKQAMKLLRHRLCYGKPGPSMGYVIALLGFEECAARMKAGGEQA